MINYGARASIDIGFAPATAAATACGGELHAAEPDFETRFRKDIEAEAALPIGVLSAAFVSALSATLTVSKLSSFSGALKSISFDDTLFTCPNSAPFTSFLHFAYRRAPLRCAH